MAQHPFDIDDNDSPVDLRDHFLILADSTRGKFGFLEPSLSDTEVVVMATSLLDKYLSFYLTCGFQSHKVSKASMAAAFEGTGPLSTFSSKITVCNLLGYILADENHDLKIIKSVRNEFAHSIVLPKLGDIEKCDSLKLRHDTIPTDKGDRRRAFMSSCAQVILLMAYGVTSLIGRQIYLTRNDEAAKQFTLEFAERMMRTAQEQRP